ncbi:MAG: hypothetical protein K8S97_06665, partial [Anaerolineae bacterium]|nr:hypothetical protein [Anaerolineae bacterium]
HIGGIDILNEPTYPGGLEGEPDWTAMVWDDINQQFNTALTFTPVNINQPGYVWASINGEDWVAGQAVDGSFNEPNEAYKVTLDGAAGVDNTIHVAIMNRWEQQNDLDLDPVVVSLPAPPSAIGSTYQSGDDTFVSWYDNSGVIGLGWTADDAPGVYSGDSTMMANGAGSDICFAFDGTEVSVVHSMLTTGSANVFVDGDLHSTITYSVQGGPQQHQHLVGNLNEGVHTVTVQAVSGTIDVDAFLLSDDDAARVIDGVADVDGSGCVEDGDAALRYTGSWSQVSVDGTGRPGTPDGFGHRSSVTNDRMTFSFTNADTVAIYRAVFAGGGMADVYVDGELRGTMNNDAVVARVVPHYVGGLDPAVVHIVEVRTNAGTPYLDLEAVRFMNFTDSVSYGNALWSQTTEGPPLDVPYDGTEELYGVWQVVNNKFYKVTEEGALATLFFEGSAAAVTIVGGSSRGVFELYLDGRLVRTVDSTAQSGSNLQLIAGGVSPDHPHTLQIRHLNINPAKPKNNRIYGYQVYYVPVANADDGLQYEEAQYDAVSGDRTWTHFLFDGKWKYTRYTREPGPSGDYYAQSLSRDARAFFYFTNADTFTLYGKGGGFGGADVYVDGVYQGLFYQRGKTTWQEPFTASGFDPDVTHVVELRIHIGSGFAKKFNIDWMLIHGRPVLEPGTYEQDAMVPIGTGLDGRAIQFTGTWTDVADVLASGNAHTVSTKETWNYKRQLAPVVEATFEVTGATSVVVYRHMRKSYGTADVYVDGRYHSSFNSYVKTPAVGTFQEPYTIAGLDPGFNHVITITPQPQGKRANRYDPIDIDYIEVRDTETPGATYIENERVENNDTTANAGGAIAYAGSYWTGTTGGVSTTTNKGDRAVVTFYGNTFQVFVNLESGSIAGTAEVYIDGVLHTIYKMKGTGLDVPISVVGLDERFHVAEVVLKKGSRLHINAFAAWTVQPLVGPQVLDFLPLNPNVYQTGNWVSNGTAWETKEKLSAQYFYVQDVDTLMLTHAGDLRRYGDIEVYVDGRRHTTIDLAAIRNGPTEATYMIAGLGSRDVGHWIEIRNPKTKYTGLVQVELLNYAGPTLGTGQMVEGEGTDVLQRYGRWLQKPGTPNSKYSGNYFIQKRDKHVHMYIPVQGINYLTVYRLTGVPGNIDVYIDGAYWGTMYNKGGAAPNVPFTIGPIPNPDDLHIVDLRENHKNKKFGIDYVVGLGLSTLQMGWYENDDVAFVGGTDPDSGTVYDAAYTGNWTLIVDPLASGGSYQRGKSKARLDAIFYGNKLTIYRHNWRYAKAMTVWVDGTAYTLYGKESTQRYDVAHTILLPNGGPHSLEIVSESGKNDFDALHIEYVAPAYYGAYQHTDDLYVALNGPHGSFDWLTADSGAASGGSYAWTNVKYTSMSFMFYGDDVTAYWEEDTDWGKMLIYLDGEFVEEWDQHAYFVDDTFGYTLSNLGRDTHVLEFRFEGKRSKGKKQINLDGFAVDHAHFPRPGDVDTPTLPGDIFLAEAGCYEELEPQWDYHGPHSASWFTYQSAAASSGKYRQAAGVAGDEIYAEVSLSGVDGFALVYHTGPQGGIAEVRIDGVSIGTIDMYSVTDQWQVVYTYAGAPLD